MENQISNFLVFLTGDRLKMIVTSSPMLEKYSRTNLETFISRPHRNFFPKLSQIHPKRSPKYAQTSPNMSQNSRKSDPKMTSASRESNPPPPASRSQDLPTRLFSPQNIAPLRSFYASKIRDVCPHACRGFFRSQNSAPRDSSAAKMATLWKWLA